MCFPPNIIHPLMIRIGNPVSKWPLQSPHPRYSTLAPAGGVGAKWNRENIQFENTQLSTGDFSKVHPCLFQVVIFNLKISSPPPKKKNETMIKAKPAPAVQEEPHPGKCDACEAAPCDRDGRSFFRDGSQRGKGVLPTFHKGRTMKTEVRLAKLSGLLGWTEEKKTREKLGTPLTFRKLWNHFWCMFKIPMCSTPSHNNLKIDFGPPTIPFNWKSVVFCLVKKSSFPVTPSSLVKPMR